MNNYHVCLCMFVFMCVCVHVVCACVRARACVYVRAHVCVCACIRLCLEIEDWFRLVHSAVSMHHVQTNLCMHVRALNLFSNSLASFSSS